MDRTRRYLATFGGFEPDARRFLFSALLAGAAMSLYWIDFNLYLVSLGIDAPTIGLIATTSAFASAVVAFPASMLSDRIGRRRVLIGGLALTTVALGGLIVTSAPLAIAGFVALYGAGQQAFMVVQNPFLMERSRPEHRSELFAVAFAIENVTNVVAAVAGGVIAQALAAAGGFDPTGPEPFRILLVFMAGIMAVAFLSLFRLRDDHPRATDLGYADRVVARRRRTAGVPRPRFVTGDRGTFVRLLVPGFLIALGAGQVIPFLNLYIAGRFGLEVAALNAVFAITALGTIGTILVQPAIARRLGRIGSVVLVQGMSIPFLVVLGFSPVLWTVIAAMAVRNSLMNAGNPIFNAFSMERVAPAERATLSAAMSVLWSLGWVIAGPWYSLLQATLGFDGGYAVNFITIIVLYSTATFLYWAWFGRDERAARAVGGANASP
jgi:MFS family permease